MAKRKPTRKPTRARAAAPAVPDSFIPCRPVSLPEHLEADAAEMAVRVNPANAPLMAPTRGMDPLPPARLTALVGRYWKVPGDGTPAKITVGFLDNPNAATRRLILEHANLWGRTGNVDFVESATAPQIRVAREADGYWSLLGTDCLSVPRGQATLNLQGFTERTPSAEYLRVVCHEFGHALGFPHGHSRTSIVARLDPRKVIAEFKRTQGWSEAEIRAQILTPLPESEVWADSPEEEEESIMVYQFSGSVTKDGRPIPGGSRITVRDANFAAKVFPGRVPSSPPPTGGRQQITPGGVPVSERIALPGEVDDFDLVIAEPGRYRVLPEPKMELGVFDAEGKALLKDAKGRPIRNYGGIEAPFKAGTYRLKAKHRLAGGTGQYTIRCEKVAG